MSGNPTVDKIMMRTALELASRARGHVSPNPMVGSVVVRDGCVIGSGFHPKPGEPHAEAFALREAGDTARGAEMYVTLEPCCHYGRTPPCTDRILESGIRRVVCAMVDPDERVAGNGISILRDAGVEVDVGLLEDESRKLNEHYIHQKTTGLPWVTLKWAQTLDGRVATSTGESKWITGSDSRAHAHRLRSYHGAVVVGIGTVLADDPRLDVRLEREPDAYQPAHVVVDTDLRLPTDARLIVPGKTFVFCGERAESERRGALENVGVEVIPLASGAGGLDLRAMLTALAEREIISVFVEGGPTLVTAFLRAGLANRIAAFIAPKVMGSGMDAVGDLETDAMTAIHALSDIETGRFGRDLFITGVLEGWACSPA
jgi:diaminohydroxyphosphoribosylaminopyrimidine deaminase / 5-amino-6-(5-phosphoribosylamino)uracil reductase